MRTAYEWEKNEPTSNHISGHIERISKEIKRISEVTLKGNFANHEDRNYWVLKLKKLNSELIGFEEMLRPAKFKKSR